MKKYWKGIEEQKNTSEFIKSSQNEFAEALPIESLLENNENVLNESTSRRDFMKYMGFGLGAVTLAACNRAPVNKAIPYLVKPEDITPGVANFYATTFMGQGILVKTREGRPIKIEGNPNCPIAQGGVDAYGHASILNLYDENRAQKPTVKGTSSTWANVDTLTKTELDKAAAAGKGIRILSNTILSPSTKAIMAEFMVKYPTAKHITYDAVSYSAIINANKNSLDKAVVPSYRFDKADVILSLDADFLGTWLSPVEFSKQYIKGRRPENKKMSQHIHIEPSLSLTGSNADIRVPVKPSQIGIVALNIYNEIATLAGAEKVQAPKSEVSDATIKKIAKALYTAKGKAITVSGSNDISTQIMVNAINSLTGAIGTTVDYDNASYQAQGNDAEVVELVKEMNAGTVGALIVWDANPVYTLPNADAFKTGLAKVPFSLSFNDRLDETTELCTVSAPGLNFLEAWDDSEAKKGVLGLVQPTIAPVYNCRAAQQLFLNILGNKAEYHDYIQNRWNVALAGTNVSWDDALRTGGYAFTPATAVAYEVKRDFAAVAQAIATQSAALKSDLELSTYQKVSMRDGAAANNPWLQEMPDPLTKATWDNYVLISNTTAVANKLSNGDVIELKAGNHTVTLPVLIQPGQTDGVLSVALGYGRTKAGKLGKVGENAYPFVTVSAGTMQYNTGKATFSATGENIEFAQTQTHHTYEGRAIIKETTLTKYISNPRSGNDQEKAEVFDLWDSYEKPGHNWGMAIDLNTCTGCSACIISCQSENNVAVVGRDEVRRRREMHWIRIDRYYTFEDEKGKDVMKEADYDEVKDYQNVRVVHQPMMCQHCDHAPCESVCPVLASMHSSEGLNQQVYNRCVGTKYCANNCPYKVRRFNWFNYVENPKFDYNMNSSIGRLALNPDVTVRSRGVMEKCSMCVQRIQYSKLQAKIAGVPLEDGKVETACSSSCPADAITFGDMNNPNSRISKLIKNERAYYVLEEINVQPGVAYLTKVRNIEEGIID